MSTSARKCALEFTSFLTRAGKIITLYLLSMVQQIFTVSIPDSTLKYNLVLHIVTAPKSDIGHRYKEVYD